MGKRQAVLFRTILLGEEVQKSPKRFNLGRSV